MTNSNKFFDLSTILLIIVNLLTIIIAIYQNWNIGYLMLVYWIQSVIIGIFNFFRILSLEEFSTQGFTINSVKVESNPQTKIRTATFFAFHYGFFHLIYLVFVLSMFFDSKQTSKYSLLFILGLSIFFFINHYISFRMFKKEIIHSKPNIGHLMFKPYIRIVPMHLTIIFGMLGSPLLLFMALKSLMDIASHKIEHKTES